MSFWPFKKKIPTLKDAGILNGFTDWHCHVLPGVDDGIPTMEKSLEVLRAYEKLGVKKVWLTPHIMEDFPNKTAALRDRYNELMLAWDGNIEVHLAAENMLDALFEERLRENDLLPIGEEGNHLLVETSYFNPPMNFDDLIDGIMAAGYYPLLAHPERYRYMTERDYQSLRERGVLFQTNMTSLVGMYGETARKKAEWLLKQNMIEVTGSDLHRLEPHMKYFNQAPKNSDALGVLTDVAASPRLK